MANSEREKLFALADALGWRQKPPSKKGYVKLECPCGKHYTWVHKTPSNPYHYAERGRFIRSRDCGAGLLAHESGEEGVTQSGGAPRSEGSSKGEA